MPKVTILMAIYRPNITWFKEQLLSLNNQDYKSLELLIWNDYPEDTTDYSSICSSCITRFKFEIYNSEENLGSNGAFENLTRLVSSKYIAYCDQDDIWLPKKISILVDILEKEKLLLVCSDMLVIDSSGEVISTSIQKYRTNQKLYYGNNQFKKLLAHNFVTGCTILAETNFAKHCLPFPTVFFHDWWLALNAAAYDSLKIINIPLIKYRIHDNQQTGTLKNITNKKEYYNDKIIMSCLRIEKVKSRFQESKYVNSINEYYKFVKYRIAYFNQISIKNIWNLFRSSYVDRRVAYFELLFVILPDCIFEQAIKFIKKL